MEKLFETHKAVFYTNYPLFVCMIICLIVSFRNDDKSFISRLFIGYIISATVIFHVLNLIIYLIIPISIVRMNVIEMANLLYACIELHVFLYFFHKIILKNWFKIFLSLSLILFYGLLIEFCIRVGKEGLLIRHISDSDVIVSYELTILTICCLIYFHYLLKQMPNKDLKKSPSFWIATGLFFNCLVILPFFFISADIFQWQINLYAIFYGVHYIFTGILFLLIAKAFSCKAALTN